MSTEITRHPIRDYRQQHGLSLEQLAKDIDISTTTLHNLEYNRGQLTARLVIAYCLKNNLSPNIFFPSEAPPVRMKKVC